jgi:hypothetical protein
MVSEISTYGWLAPLFLGYAEAEHHGRIKVVNLMVARRQIETGRDQARNQE